MKKQITTLNEAADEVRRLCIDKGFPQTPKDINFLLHRIRIELGEAFNELEKSLSLRDRDKYINTLKEELTDVFIQTIQALGALGADIDEEFRAKMDKNWKRNWKKHE